MTSNRSQTQGNSKRNPLVPAFDRSRIEALRQVSIAGECQFTRETEAIALDTNRSCNMDDLHVNPDTQEREERHGYVNEVIRADVPGVSLLN